MCKTLDKASCVKFFYDKTIEEYASSIAKFYDIKVSQLSPGVFHSAGTLVDLGDVKLLKKSSKLKHLINGHNKGDIVFLLPLNNKEFYGNSSLYGISRQWVSSGEIELNLIIPENFERLFVVITSSSLSKYLSQEEIKLFMEGINSLESIDISVMYKKAATHFVHRLYNELLQDLNPSGKEKKIGLQSYNNKYCGIIILFLYEYISFHRQCRKPALRPRYEKIVSRAIDYIENNPGEDITLSSLSRNIYASKRSIQYAFAKITGLSPIKYLKISRMNHIRRRLLYRGNTRVKISDVLHEFGISNYGRFSSEYCKLFAERPKDTISRGASMSIRNGNRIEA